MRSPTLSYLSANYYREQEDALPDVRVLSSRTSTARVRHICDTCGGQIRPGERYSRTALVYEGEFQAFKQHVFCPPAP